MGWGVLELVTYAEREQAKCQKEGKFFNLVCFLMKKEAYDQEGAAARVPRHSFVTLDTMGVHAGEHLDLADRLVGTSRRRTGRGLRRRRAVSAPSRTNLVYEDVEAAEEDAVGGSR